MPVLGICYGMQLMTDTLGGRVAPGAASRVRSRDGARHDPRRVCFGDLPTTCACGRATATSSKPRRRVHDRRHERQRAGRGDGGRPTPPVRRCCFIQKSPTRIAGSRSSGTSRSTSAAARATGRWRRSSTRRRRGSASRSATGRVVCGLSGGVDSTVAAVLIHRAIGDRLTCIFVDNGAPAAGRSRRRCRRASATSCRLPLEFVDASRRRS